MTSGVVYSAFGDESVTPSGAFYGFFLVPNTAVSELEVQIEAIKASFGVAKNQIIHCKELFNESARSKGFWSHLTINDATEFARRIFLSAKIFNPVYLIAVSLRENFPQRFRLLGRNGHPDLVHKIDEKWITLNLFQGLVGSFDPQQLLAPPEYSASGRPQNQPYWQVIVKREGPGLCVNEICIDSDITKIRWFSKSFQWNTLAKDIVVESPLGKTFLPIRSSSASVDPLLQLADLFVYFQGRAFGSREINLGEIISDDVQLHIVGEKCEEVVRGTPEDVEKYWLKMQGGA